MHRLVDTQPLDVRPIEHVPALLGHLLGVEQRGERHVLRARRRLDPTQQVTEREAEPRDDHRPCLDASHAIDALFEREPSQQRVDVDDLRPAHLTFDGDRPRARSQRAGPFGRVALLGAELVEVVVRGDVAERRLRLVGPVGSTASDRERRLAGAGHDLGGRRLRLGPASPHQPEQPAADPRAGCREEAP